MDFSFLEIFQYKTSKEGSTVGVTVTHACLLAHCQALTQACGYSEGKGVRAPGDWLNVGAAFSPSWGLGWRA